MVDINRVNPDSYKQTERSCIMMALSIIVKCFTGEKVEDFVKKLILNKKGKNYNINNIITAEQVFMHEAYNVNHSFFLDYFDKYLFNKFPFLSAKLVYPSACLSEIEADLISKQALLSTAIYEKDQNGHQDTHIVIIGYDINRKFYIIDTRPNSKSFYTLGNSISTINSINFPSFLNNPANQNWFEFGDCLLIESNRELDN